MVLGKFGVAVNGVPIEPAAAEYYNGQRNNWNYNALGGAISLGFDANFGHVQPTGLYHYHGVPTGLMQVLGWSKSNSPLIGYAGDGFPIYALAGKINGRSKMVKSSYQLKSGNRPGGQYPSGRHDGAFVEDYTYVAGSGDLDSCNGAMITSADYPSGTYAYFITNAFPFVPRAFKGTADRSFKARR